jgi:phage-related protein
MAIEQIIAPLAGAAGFLLSTTTIDVVGVYDDTGTQVFKKARPINGSIKSDSKLMEHPLENGASVIDHKILNPIEIELRFIVSGFDFQDVYEEIRQIYESSDILTITTKASIYESHIVKSMPHVEVSEIHNGIELTFTTLQARFITPETQQATSSPQRPADAKTVDRSKVQPVNPTPEDNVRKTSSLAPLLKV